MPWKNGNFLRRSQAEWQNTQDGKDHASEWTATEHLAGLHVVQHGPRTTERSDLMGFPALSQTFIVNQTIVQSSQRTSVPTVVMNASRLQAEQSRGRGW